MIGNIIHWDGSQWETMTTYVDHNLNAITGFSDSAVFAVGDSGTIIAWNGIKWNPFESPVAVNLRSIWGTDSSNLWVAGDEGAVYEWNGFSWTDHSSDPQWSYHTVSGNEAGWVVVAGEDGIVGIRVDGEWRFERPSMDALFLGVEVSNDGQVTAVTGDGRIFLRNGSIWSEFAPVTDNSLEWIVRAASAHLFAGGAGGTILMLEPDEPLPTPTPAPSSPTPSPGPTIPTPTPTPPTCTMVTVELAMPASHFEPSDPFYLNVTVCNPSSMSLVEFPLFVVLDVFGEYYFGPSFGQDLDFFGHGYTVWPQGSTIVPVVPEFFWPDTGSSADGIVFLSALVDPTMTRIIGQMDSLSFGWDSR